MLHEGTRILRQTAAEDDRSKMQRAPTSLFVFQGNQRGKPYFFTSSLFDVMRWYLLPGDSGMVKKSKPSCTNGLI